MLTLLASKNQRDINVNCYLDNNKIKEKLYWIKK